MMFRIAFGLEGETQLSRVFQVSEDAVQDLAPAFKVIGQQVQEGVAAQLASQGARGGGPWQALSAAYGRWKALHYPGKPILERTGAMKGALLSPGAVHASAQRLVYEPDTSVAPYHQKGDGHLPQRKVVQLTDLDRRGWERTILTWVRHKQGRAAWPPVGV